MRPQVRFIFMVVMCLAAAGCLTILSPAGRRCDAEHPCLDFRVCSAEGVCVEPSKPGVDGGPDGGPEGATDAGTDAGQWREVFFENWEGFALGGSWSTGETLGRWAVQSGDVGPIQDAGTEGKVLAMALVPGRIATSFDASGEFTAEMSFLMLLSPSHDAGMWITARTGSSPDTGYTLALTPDGWSVGYSGAQREVWGQGTWPNGSPAQTPVFRLEVTSTEVILKNHNSVIASAPRGAFPARIEGLSIDLRSPNSSVRLYRFVVEGRAP